MARRTTVTSILEAEQVRYAYPGAAGPAIDGVSISLERGEIVAIVGESGSGKSTLVRLAAGLLTPVAGSVRVAGLDTRVANPRAVAARLAFVFQQPAHQLLAATVRDELQLGPRATGCPAGEAAARAAATAERLGLDGVVGVHPLRLSIGARKLVTVAAALTMHPSILVLDEPTTGLDRRESAWIGTILREEATRGTAVLLVTHDLGFAAAVADRVMLLRAGRVVADGQTAAVLADQRAIEAAGLEAPPIVRLWTALGLDPRDAPPTVEAARAALQALEIRIDGEPSS